MGQVIAALLGLLIGTAICLAYDYIRDYFDARNVRKARIAHQKRRDEELQKSRKA